MPAQNRKTILVLVSAFDGTVSQTDTVLLANQLARLGWRVFLATLDRAGALSDRIADGVTLLDLGQGASLPFPASVFALRRLLGRLRPVALIASEPATGPVSLAAVSGLPKAIRPKLVLRDLGQPERPFWTQALVRLAEWRADLTVVSVNDASHASPSASWHRRAIAHIPGLSQSLVARLGLPLPRLRQGILAIGELSARNDLAILVLALALLDKAHLTILGQGSERPRLERLARELDVEDRVWFAGSDADPHDLLPRASLLVLPGETREPWLGQALAAGTPILAGGTMALRRGFRTVRRDPIAMAEAIAASLAHPIDRHALATRAARCTVEHAAVALDGLLAEALSVHATPAWRVVAVRR